MMDIPQYHERIIPSGRQNRPKRKNACKYITIHETANTKRGADAEAHAVYLCNTTKKVSWHYTVDDTNIWQHLPDCEDAFHAGDGSGKGNRQSIGIEICVNEDGDYEQALKNTALLVGLLMARHKIPFSNVVQHYFWTKKDCPMRLRKQGRWEEFLSMTKRGITLNEALEILYKKGIVNTPEYWETAATVVKNLDLLLIKFATAI